MFCDNIIMEENFVFTRMCDNWIVLYNTQMYARADDIRFPGYETCAVLDVVKSFRGI